MAFFDWLAAAADARDRSGLTRRLTTHGSEVLDLAGNDYLGLRRHPVVLAVATGALHTYGAGSGASRLVTGTQKIHFELEHDLAEHMGAESALVFSSGYAANLAVVSALSDTDTLVVSDAHAHASLVDGCRLSRAQVEVARHNDIDHVADLLTGRSQPRALVLVESIYSVNGDAAPLERLVSVTGETGAVLVVDEAHGLGVLGDRGEGGLGAAGLAGLEHVVVTTTLSKALASQGGAVLGHALVRDHLVNAARSFIFDTGLAPASAGAALGALDVLRENPSLAKQVRHNAAVMAEACGLEPPPGAVMSVTMPGPTEALQAVDVAAAHRVRIGCFRPPSTPDGSSRLRVTAHADHTPQQLAHACEVLRKVVP